MNYIAHTFLTFPNTDISLGNFIGDMITNKEFKALPKPLREGVIIHRTIDSHTDNHESMRSVVKLLRARHGKYAPVVADILLDHILMLDWSDHTDMAFEEFEQWVYELVKLNMDLIPERVHPRVQKMIEGQWLKDYGTDEGMQFILSMMDRRAQFPSNFGLGMLDLKDYRVEMGEALHELIPDLRTAISNKLNELSLEV